MLIELLHTLPHSTLPCCMLSIAKSDSRASADMLRRRSVLNGCFRQPEHPLLPSPHRIHLLVMHNLRKLKVRGTPLQVSRAMSSTASLQLPLKPPSVVEEENVFRERVADMETFFKQPRFASLSRPYTATDIVAKQGSMPVLPLPSTLMADKLYKLLTEAANEKRPVHTIGAIDPVQMTQLAPYSEVVYISGWVASSTLTTGFNDVGPDLG